MDNQLRLERCRRKCAHTYDSPWSGDFVAINVNEQYTPFGYSSPDLSPSPEPTPTPYEEPQQIEQDMTTGAIVAVASIVVFLGLLFYFIKRR